MKKVLSVLIALVTLMTFSACGTQTKNADSHVKTSKNAKTESTESYLDTEESALKYVGIEKVMKALTDEYKGQYLIKFDYTNKTSEPTQCQFIYDIKVFQNGVQIDSSDSSYSSNGGKQYELMKNYFLETMDGGTVTFGRMYKINDKTDLTVILEDKSDNKTKFVIKADEFTNLEEITPELIQEKLQGSWDALGQIMTFEGNKISIGDKINGTITVLVEESVVKASLVATDGIVTIKLPYTYENGEFKLYNNQNQEVIKK